MNFHDFTHFFKGKVAFHVFWKVCFVYQSFIMVLGPFSEDALPGGSPEGVLWRALGILSGNCSLEAPGHHNCLFLFVSLSCFFVSLMGF